jgi:hypothetical protein
MGVLTTSMKAPLTQLRPWAELLFLYAVAGPKPFPLVLHTSLSKPPQSSSIIKHRSSTLARLAIPHLISLTEQYGI